MSPAKKDAVPWPAAEPSKLAGGELTLFHYWRSSSSWRVRMALALKGLTPRFVHVGLLDGEVEGAEHRRRNPFGYVPVLQVGARHLVESLPIMELLDEFQPAPPLFPGDAFDRAHVRALCEFINAGIQPVQNLNVMDRHSSDPAERKRWNQFFIGRGLEAYEAFAAPRAGIFSVGDRVTAADCCLIPQVYNAIRFEVPLSRFPLLAGIYERAMALPAVAATAPDRFEPLP